MQALASPIRTAWEKNQKRQITSEGFVEVDYRVTDPTLLQNISKTDAEKTVIQKPALSKHEGKVLGGLLDEADRKIAPYATLEPKGRFPAVD